MVMPANVQAQPTVPTTNPPQSNIVDGKKAYVKPELTVHGDMRTITRAIIGGDFNDGTFTGTIDGHPGFS